VIEYFRLAFGTIVVLLPGAAVARALGQRSISAVLAWGLACVFVAWTVVFIVHSNIEAAALVLAALGIGALVARRISEPGSLTSEPGSQDRRTRFGSGALLVGIVLGFFLWHVEGVVVGDGLFHEARVAQARRPRQPAPAHGRRRSRTAACTRGTPSRSGTASSRSSAGCPVSMPAA